MKRLMWGIAGIMLFAGISCGEGIEKVGGSDLGATSKSELMFNAYKSYKDGTTSSDGSDAKPDGNAGGSTVPGGDPATGGYGAMPLCPEIIGIDFSTCPTGKGCPVFIIDFSRACVLGMKCDYNGGGTEPACPLVYDPVCGWDNVTYDNDCFAKLSGQGVQYRGECKNQGTCKDWYPEKPVCGPNEKIEPVYDEMGCVIAFECVGGGTTECPAIAKPAPDFCKEGEYMEAKYDYNGCIVGFYCVPATDNGTACPEIYAPVCGIIGNDYVTFPNKCYAEMKGAKIISEGECKNTTDPTCPVGMPNPDAYCPDGSKMEPLYDANGCVKEWVCTGENTEPGCPANMPNPEAYCGPNKKMVPEKYDAAGCVISYTCV